MTLPIPRTRVLLLSAAGILLIALGCYTLWWYQLAHSVRAGMDRWIAARTAAGWQVSTGQVTQGGFPFDLTVTLAAPSVVDPSGTGWQGPPITLVVSPFSPGQAHLSGPGRHALVLAGGPIGVMVKDGTADLRFDRSGLVDGAAAFVGIAADVPVSIDSLAVTVNRLSTDAADHAVASWGLSASLNGLALPQDPRLVLGHSISSARLELRLMGNLGAGALPQAVAAWRDDGGTVEIDALSLDWPPLGLTGKGTVALDRNMQPMLASSCTIRGLFDAVDSLSRAGTIRAKDAGMAKLVLGLLMKPGADGTKELTVPVGVQDRTLSVGPVPLMKVPEVVW